MTLDKSANNSRTKVSLLKPSSFRKSSDDTAAPMYQSCQISDAVSPAAQEQFKLSASICSVHQLLPLSRPTFRPRLGHKAGDTPFTMADQFRLPHFPANHFIRHDATNCIWTSGWDRPLDRPQRRCAGQKRRHAFGAIPERAEQRITAMLDLTESTLPEEHGCKLCKSAHTLDNASSLLSYAGRHEEEAAKYQSVRTGLKLLGNGHNTKQLTSFNPHCDRKGNRRPP